MKWCTTYHWPKSKAFYYKKYGAPNAHLLANEVARRSQHFYDIWLLQDNSHYAFTDADIAAYVETLEYLTAMLALDESVGQTIVFDACVLIRKMCPK